MNQQYDIVIIGAGPAGCVIAERCATQLNWKVLLVDKRNHIAGNCFDEIHESGVLIHKYGPHYFRTNSKEIIEYLSQFTDWIPGDYFVKSFVAGSLYSFPINLFTISKFFNIEANAKAAKKKLEEEREKISDPQNSEEFILSKIGRKMYEAFYLNYTVKQWNKHPKELDASVCGRVPVRLNKNERYVDATFQLMPKEGFTKLFNKMIDHPNIDIQLNTDFAEIKNKNFAQKALVYSGPIDEYFNYSLGKLGYRSLKFEFKEFKKEYKQSCVQINYPNDHDYTRSVEIKHVTKQKSDNTVISYEYPTDKGDPYYPVPSNDNSKLYQEYKKLAEKETEINNVHFCGRLATYKYMNIDEVMESALKKFEDLSK